MNARTPRPIDRLPERESVGRVYALYDEDQGAEVLGTMLSCWPDRGPTWALRLHEPLSPGQLTTVHLYEGPHSKLGRWFVTREVPMSKKERYANLVRARKAYDAENALKLANPSRVEGGRYDSEEIGPWTRWAGNLDADLMVVGQDWGDVRYFVQNAGFDAPGNPTSHALADLLASVGRPLPSMPTAASAPATNDHRSTRVFLTNALLWLKEGGMSSAVSDESFAGTSATFLLEQIAIVQPRVVVGLGRQAYNAILRAHDLAMPKGSFRRAVEDDEGVLLPGMPQETRLLAVYHCGARVRNTIRTLEQQRHDWDRVRKALDR